MEKVSGSRVKEVDVCRCVQDEEEEEGVRRGDVHV